MSRPNDATEPFIAESEVSGDATERQQQRRQRRQIQQERRRAFRDRHFQDGETPGICWFQSYAVILDHPQDDA